MIGQKNLLKLISEQMEFNDFPRFSIIVGPEGSGKKTLTNWIAERLDYPRAIIEPKVDSIRQMIKECYDVKSPVLYVIIDSDKMSQQAKNAMLKVCEETPNNAYIIMLVNDMETVLPTIRSRACVYHMERYTTQELLEFAGTKDYAITEICETPGDVIKLEFIGVKEFYDYVLKVVNHIAVVSPANALKIRDEIDFKGDDPEKYDVTLFFRAFRSICGTSLMNAVKTDDIEGQMIASAGIKVATKYLEQLKITGINKSAVFDMFILEMQKEWDV